tara:strand:+ start:902 stop:1126 length:225 start_codon:yes stop_codon:yes gene_type:complete
MPTISFDDWKNEINTIVKTEVGYNLDELPDMQYRIWFDNQNLTSKQVSFIIIGEYYKEFELNVNYAKEQLLKTD